jgi:hypothetical protein
LGFALTVLLQIRLPVDRGPRIDSHVDDALDEPALKLTEAHSLQLGEAHVQMAISDVVLVARLLRPLVRLALDPRDEVLNVSAEHPWLWVAEIERDLG